MDTGIICRNKICFCRSAYNLNWKYSYRKMLLPTKSSVPSIVKLAMFQTILQYIFFYIGLAHNSGVKASIINGSNTFFVILVSTIIFRQEKLNLKKIIGCVIGFAGVIVVSMNGQKIDMNLSIMGDGSLFLCALSYAFSSCLMKNYSKKDNPVMLSGYQFIFGGIVMIILGLVMGGRITHVSVSAILMLFYLACISAVAYSIWGILLSTTRYPKWQSSDSPTLYSVYFFQPGGLEKEAESLE